MTRLVPAVIAAILLAVRAPVGAVTVAGAFVVSPLVAFGVVAAVVTVHLMGERTRHIAEDAEQRFLSDLASVVGAGADLRAAVVSSQSTVVDGRTRRMCELGVPMGEVAGSLAPGLRSTGRELAAVAAVSEEAGASIGPALGMLSHHAGQLQQQRRDAGVALAQARFSAIVVGVVPLVIGVAVVLVRGIPEPGGAMVVVPMILGSAMMMSGAAVVLTVARRVSQW